MSGPVDSGQLWSVPLQLFPGVVAEMRQLLSDDERARADRLQSVDDQRRFIVCRAALRTRLGLMLDVPPASVSFDYGNHGKPALAAPFAGVGLQFNVSHSGELALIAVTQGASIGVDIEFPRQLNDRDALVRRYFSRAENIAYFSTPEAERQQAFFNCWTRKEALIKALGRGLSYPLRKFDVSVSPAMPAKLLRFELQKGPLSGWCLTGFEPAAGYVAAVAVQGVDCHLA